MADELAAVLQHIVRPMLPWRTAGALTECGKPVESFPAEVLLSGADALVKFKRLGVQRASLSTCMTCVTTVDRRGVTTTWDSAPVKVLSRWLGHTPWDQRYQGRSQLDQELRAIGLLIAAHPVEFADLVAGLDATGDLAAARRARAAKRR